MEMLTVPEAARIARICPRSIYNHMNAGALLAIKVGRRSFIRRADLEAFLDAAPAYAPKKAA